MGTEQEGGQKPRLRPHDAPMRLFGDDTSPEAERYLIDAYRRMTPAQKLARVRAFLTSHSPTSANAIPTPTNERCCCVWPCVATAPISRANTLAGMWIGKDTDLWLCRFHHCTSYEKAEPQPA